MKRALLVLHNELLVQVLENIPQRPVCIPNKTSGFLQGSKHLHIRVHIRPKEDLAQTFQCLDLFIRCLSPDRKTTGLTLHFD